MPELEYPAMAAYDPDTAQPATALRGESGTLVDADTGAPVSVQTLKRTPLGSTLRVSSGRDAALPGFIDPNGIRSDGTIRRLHFVTDKLPPQLVWSPVGLERAAGGSYLLASEARDAAKVVQQRIESGDRGQQGDRGLPGVNAVPADAAVAAYADSEGSATRAALEAVIAQALSQFSPGDAGRTFVSKLRTGQNVVIAAAGDSTGDRTWEYLAIGVRALVDSCPGTSLNERFWSTSTDAYDAELPSLTGIAGRTTVLRDEFERTAADLVGSTPDVGPAWAADGYGPGDYRLTGTSAAATTDPPPRGRVNVTVPAGDIEITTTVYLPGAGAPNIIVRRVDDSNLLYAVLERSAAGVRLQLFKRIGAVSALAAPMSYFILPATGFDDTFEVKLRVVGNRYTGSVNGVTTGTTLSSAEVAAIAPATLVGIMGSTPGPAEYCRFQADLLTPATTPPVATFLNGSREGTVLTFQQARISTMYPASMPVDVLLINSGWNYGASTTPATYLTAIDTFIATFAAAHPTASIVIASQNPGFSPVPADELAAHRVRNGALRAYCARKGYGYIAGYESYTARVGGGQSGLLGDGKHPLGGDRFPAGTGAQAAALVSYFNTL